MKDIKNYSTFTKVEPIEIGWSSDGKYYVETEDGGRLFLRIAKIAEYDRKKCIYDRMRHMHKHSISMPEPMDFGTCDHGESVYYITKWCDGEKLEDILPTLSDAEQYAIGVKSGKLAAKISAVPIEETELAEPDWYERYNAFMYESIRWFHKSGVEVPNARSITDYFYDNRYLLKTRPQCYYHEDMQPGNMLLTTEQDLILIDWEAHLFSNYGDPWLHTSYMNETSRKSATGFVHSLFDGEPPDEFWRVLMLYKVIGALSVITWAYYHSPGSLEDVTNNCANSTFLEWHGGDIRNIVPDWYVRKDEMR